MIHRRTTATVNLTKYDESDRGLSDRIGSNPGVVSTVLLK